MRFLRPLVLVLGCVHLACSMPFRDGTSQTATVTDLRPSDVEAKFGIAVLKEEHGETTYYSGYYSYLLSPDGKEVLHGSFELKHELTTCQLLLPLDACHGEYLIETRISYSGKYTQTHRRTLRDNR